MDSAGGLIDIILHVDKHLDTIIRCYGLWTYAIFFLIVFLETGLVVTPFLPGDSLLFAIGTFAALGSLDLRLSIIILSSAAIIGDTVNYWIGYNAGPRIFRREDALFFRKDYLIKTHRFYERHGGKTIIFARFIPIIRTFAPFVAGIGTMNYWRFIAYNITGGIAWVVIFISSGYFFGNIPVVKNNFSYVIIIIVIISITPPMLELVRSAHRK